jgi:hypothetical protein
LGILCKQMNGKVQRLLGGGRKNKAESSTHGQKDQHESRQPKPDH